MDNNAAMGDTLLSARVAEEVRALMARRRMSGRKLAELLGVSPSWVSYRMTGVTPIALDELGRIAQILDVEVVDLFPRQNEGRVVGIAGSPRRQTTVSKLEQPNRPTPIDRPKRTSPPASTRRPARTRAAHAQTRPQRRMSRTPGAGDGEA